MQKDFQSMEFKLNVLNIVNFLWTVDELVEYTPVNFSQKKNRRQKNKPKHGATSDVKPSAANEMTDNTYYEGVGTSIQPIRNNVTTTDISNSDLTQNTYYEGFASSALPSEEQNQTDPCENTSVFTNTVDDLTQNTYYEGFASSALPSGEQNQTNRSDHATVRANTPDDLTLDTCYESVGAVAEAKKSKDKGKPQHKQQATLNPGVNVNSTAETSTYGGEGCEASTSAGIYDLERNVSASERKEGEYTSVYQHFKAEGRQRQPSKK